MRKSYHISLSLFLLAFAIAACDGLEPLGDEQLERRSEQSISTPGMAESDLFAAGRVLARFQPGTNAAAIAQAHGAQIDREIAFGISLLRVPGGQELTVINALSRNPNVEFAEPDFIRTFGLPCKSGECDSPDDPFFGYKWDLHNDGTIKDSSGDVLAQTGKEDADMDWLEAFDHLGNAGGAATIGILDTGIRNDHQEFAGGRIKAQHDFHAGRASAEDDNGHGTHVAGIAAARGNDGLGVPGVAYVEGIDLVVAKVCGPIHPPRFGQNYGCFTSNIVDGIKWAADNGADALNLSLGGASASQSEQQALQYARQEKNALPFCAAGNNAGSVSYPAAFPECVAVSATNWSDGLASYSNFGSQIEIAAPGGDTEHSQGYSYILASYHQSSSSYAFIAGTSMASPQAAGLAGLLHALGLTGADEKLDRIKQTADAIGPANQFGSGRINVWNALQGKSGEPVPNQPPAASFTYDCEGLACQFTDTSSDPDGFVVSWNWSFGDGMGSADQHPAHTYGEAGDFLVTLTVTDDDGASDSHSTNVTVSDETGEPDPSDIVLTGSGYKVRGINHVDLSWTGSSAPSFDVYRNGSQIATVGGTTHTDSTGQRGGGSYTYQVCEAGTTTCSNDAVVTF